MITEAELEQLIAAARQVQEHAYAPYSHFRVGAAVLTEAGQVFVGANVENASYGLTICAERSAIVAAVAGSSLLPRLRAVVVASDATPPVTPCGACRQVLVEFGAQAQVICVNRQGERRSATVAELLPGAFSSADLNT